MHAGQCLLEQELKARHHLTEENSSNLSGHIKQIKLKEEEKHQSYSCYNIDLEDMGPLAFLKVLGFESLCHGIWETANPKTGS